MLTKPFINTIGRNFSDPVSYTDPSILKQPWSDHDTHPLEPWEKWNKDRRATNNGTPYDLDSEGMPVNPYANYGIKGRGIVGMYGPNHAVDNGILKIAANDQGKPALFALGIIRKKSGLPALCGGFTSFVPYGKGSYPYTLQVKVNSQAQEFFEEMVSGSVPLLPVYAEGLEGEITSEIQTREHHQNATLSQRSKETICAQITTHRKLIQVQTEDPLFMSGLRTAFREAQPCYEGPVISTSRNTNTSWMETKLSYFMMDDAKWEAIKGKNVFDYQFAAGDDAADVMWHEITPALVDKAQGHGAFFTFLLSGALLTHPPKDPNVLAALKDQGRDLLTFFNKKSVPDKIMAYE